MVSVSREEFDMLKSKVDNYDKVMAIVQEQTISIKELAVEIKYMREEQSDLKDRVKELESKPIKNYDSIKSMITSGIVSTIIGTIAVLIGLKK